MTIGLPLMMINDNYLPDSRYSEDDEMTLHIIIMLHPFRLAG